MKTKTKVLVPEGRISGRSSMQLFLIFHIFPFPSCHVLVSCARHFGGHSKLACVANSLFFLSASQHESCQLLLYLN